MKKIRIWKLKLVRRIFQTFYRKITSTHKETMFGDRHCLGHPRLVDITELECGHIYWQEIDGNLNERFCDMCFQVWIISKFKNEYDGKGWAEWWDRYLRKRIIGRDY